MPDAGTAASLEGAETPMRDLGAERGPPGTTVRERVRSRLGDQFEAVSFAASTVTGEACEAFGAVTAWLWRSPTESPT